ncbi:hypothetical protein OC845_000820 [Tilletia horrida]|nr:hypothetical protein OC845_000820 [Tilletia horrida]
MPARPPFKPAPSLKPAEAAAKAAVTNRTLSNLIPKVVARVPPPAPLSDTVKALRRNYKFAAVCQFLFTFGDTILVGEESDSKTLESALDGKDSSYVPKLCIRILQTLTLNRNIDTSSYIQALQAQADKRAHRYLPVSDTLKPRPPKDSDPFPTLPSLAAAVPLSRAEVKHEPVKAENPADALPSTGSSDMKLEETPVKLDGVEGSNTAPDAADQASKEVEPVPLITDITTLPAADQVDVLHTLCEWHMMDPDRLRKLLKSEDDPQSWRIEPIGWDAQDNTYYLFDDNRLWIHRARPKKPRAVQPKKQQERAKGKGKGAAKAKGKGKMKEPAQTPKKRGRPPGGGKAARQVKSNSGTPNSKKRPRSSRDVGSDDDDDFEEDSDDAEASSPKRRNTGNRARGRAPAKASPSTRGRPARKSNGRSSALDELGEDHEEQSSPSGPRKLRTRNGPPPPYAYQTGFVPAQPSRGIRASSRIRGGGVGTSGPFGDDGWQRIPEALLELDESIREEDERKKGRRRSTRMSTSKDDDDFNMEEANDAALENNAEDDDAGSKADAKVEGDGEPSSNGGQDQDVVMDEVDRAEDVNGSVPTTRQSRRSAAKLSSDRDVVSSSPMANGKAAVSSSKEESKAEGVKEEEDDGDDDDDELSELSELSDSEDAEMKEESDDESGSLTPVEEFEDDEDEYEPAAADFVEFEAICVTKAEWEAFGSRFAGSRNKNEKALHAVVNETILPRILEDFAEEERLRAIEIVMASRKRSSRIASRDSEREERERLETARREQEAKMARLQEEEDARLAKERAEAEAAAAREERIREREERLAAREREIIARMEREEAERQKAEQERELRVARRKALIASGGSDVGENSRATSQDVDTSKDETMTSAQTSVPPQPNGLDQILKAMQAQEQGSTNGPGSTASVAAPSSAALAPAPAPARAAGPAPAQALPPQASSLDQKSSAGVAPRTAAAPGPVPQIHAQPQHRIAAPSAPTSLQAGAPPAHSPSVVRAPVPAPAAPQPRTEQPYQTLHSGRPAYPTAPQGYRVAPNPGPALGHASAPKYASQASGYPVQAPDGGGHTPVVASQHPYSGAPPTAVQRPTPAPGPDHHQGAASQLQQGQRPPVTNVQVNGTAAPSQQHPHPSQGHPGS